jgi:hypothetical protein
MEMVLDLLGLVDLEVLEVLVLVLVLVLDQ